MKANEIELKYKRKRSEDAVKVLSSTNTSDVLRAYWGDDEIDFFESFVILCLSQNNSLLGIYKVSVGSLNTCIVDVRKIFQAALLANAASIILAHNHPSGNTSPSGPDKTITKKIQAAGKHLDINVLDHIILTSDSYLSFADEGIL